MKLNTALIDAKVKAGILEFKTTEYVTNEGIKHERWMKMWLGATLCIFITVISYGKYHIVNRAYFDTINAKVDCSLDTHHKQLEMTTDIHMKKLENTYKEQIIALEKNHNERLDILEHNVAILIKLKELEMKNRKHQ